MTLLLTPAATRFLARLQRDRAHHFEAVGLSIPDAAEEACAGVAVLAEMFAGVAEGPVRDSICVSLERGRSLVEILGEEE